MVLEKAYTDGYAYDEYSNFYLISVLGHDSSVKAITSALVSGARVEIISTPSINLSKNYFEKYKILSTKLGSGLLHQIVLADSFFNFNNGYRLLYINRKEHAPQIVYENIRKRYSVPLILEWATWLYKKIKETGGLEELLDPIKVLKLTINEDEISALVSDGIKNREIVF